QGLHDEVADDTAVVGVHAWTVRVEDSRHANIDSMLAVIVKEQGLRTTLALVVATALPDWIDMPPVALGLRVHLRIAIDLARRRLKDACLRALGQPEHVDRANDTSL